MKVLIVGWFEPSALELSYEFAFTQLGHEVHRYDIGARAGSILRLGKLGRRVLDYVAVDAWIRQVNVDLVRTAIEWQPDLVLAIGMSPLLRGGALGQIRVSTGARSAFLWPDPLSNFGTLEQARLSSFDIVASYSNASCDVLRQWGCTKVLWLPFAGDERFFSPDEHPKSVDVVFIGGWRQEREDALSTLSDFDMRIWGPGWKSAAKRNQKLRSAVQPGLLVGTAYFDAMRSARVNVNPIDSLNYPSCNMRFFEIASVGGAQVASACPEMADEFRPGEHVESWNDFTEVPTIVRRLLDNPAQAEALGRSAFDLVRKRHTYAERVRTLLAAVEAL